MDRPVRTRGRGRVLEGTVSALPGPAVSGQVAPLSGPATRPLRPDSPRPSAPRSPCQARSRHQRPAELSEGGSPERRGASIQGGHPPGGWSRGRAVMPAHDATARRGAAWRLREPGTGRAGLPQGAAGM